MYLLKTFFVMSALYGMLPLAAQDNAAKSKQLIQDAPYLIEAYLFDAEYFYGPDKNFIYTAIRAYVLNDYKNNIPRDTITIILEGGMIDDDNQLSAYGQLPPFNLEKTFFILLKKNVYPTPKGISRDQTYALYLKDPATAARYSDNYREDFEVAGFYDMEFKTLDALKAFLADTLKP